MDQTMLKCEVDREKLLVQLKETVKVLPRISPKPILHNVVISTNGSAMGSRVIEIKGTDLDVGVMRRVVDVAVAHDGVIVLPGGLLVTALKAMGKGSRVRLEAELDQAKYASALKEAEDRLEGVRRRNEEMVEEFAARRADVLDNGDEWTEGETVPSSHLEEEFVPADTVTMPVVCHITDGAVHTRILSEDVADFPELPTNSTHVWSQPRWVEVDHLAAGWRRAKFAIARERRRYALNGVLMVAKGNMLNLVSTDMKRLSFVRLHSETGVGGSADGKAILPAAVLDRVLSLAGKTALPWSVPSIMVEFGWHGGDEAVSDAEVMVGDPDVVRFSTAVGSVVSRAISGQFPPCETVIPVPFEDRDDKVRAEKFKNGAGTVTLKLAELMAGVKAVYALSPRDAKAIVLDVGGCLRLSAKDVGRGAESWVDVGIAEAVGGCSMRLGLNPSFLLDVLEVVEGDTGGMVRLSFEGSDLPVWISECAGGVEFRHVIMPLRIV